MVYIVFDVVVLFQMSIIFDEYGLTDVQPPCVAQSFINHNAVLYKVFAIGDRQFIVERPSIKNFSPRGRLILVNSGFASRSIMLFLISFR